MKKFAFLFPDQQHFDMIISMGSYGWGCSSWKKRWKTLFEKASEEEKSKLREKAIKEQQARYTPKFFRVFNKCINERYRENGFGINWISLDNEPISRYVGVLPEDRIIFSGVNFVLNNKKEKTFSGSPDFYSLADKIDYCNHLRVGGFMVWDCVDKFSREAYRKGLDVLVDEDLTDFFPSRIIQKEFRTEKYPSIDFRKVYLNNSLEFEEFLRPRMERQWMHTNY